jgi:methionyl-tRNA formyltransferase
MRVTLLCSNTNHAVMPYLRQWAESRITRDEVTILSQKSELIGGDILFLVSCSEIISESDRDKFRAALVLHASDLPKGRGWSPHIWEICGGATSITLSLLEAEDKVDSGRIWAKQVIEIPLHFLSDEINSALFRAELDLMDLAVEKMNTIEPMAQSQDVEPSYYERRTPEHSRLDPQKSIAEQFNLMRVSDPDRYPAFFEMHGKLYKVRLEKMHDTDN